MEGQHAIVAALKNVPRTCGDASSIVIANMVHMLYVPHTCGDESPSGRHLDDCKCSTESSTGCSRWGIRRLRITVINAINAGEAAPGKLRACSLAKAAMPMNRSGVAWLCTFSTTALVRLLSLPGCCNRPRKCRIRGWTDFHCFLFDSGVVP